MTDAKRRAEALSDADQAALDAVAAAKARRAHKAETPEARERQQALQEVRRKLKRRVDTADMDPMQAMARGLITEGKHIRVLAPTPQVGLMAVAYKRRAALLTPRQVAGLGVYHQAWVGGHADRGVVDPAQVRVDGGGGGDSSWAMARAIESLREFKRLRAAVGDGLTLALIDHVVLFDQDLHSYHDARTAVYSQEKMKGPVRVAGLLQGADAIARKLWP